MRIAIIAPGSRGDLQPYIALGVGLEAAGHFVRLVTHQDFADLVLSHNLAFWPIHGSVQAIAQSTAMRARLEKGNFAAVLRQMAADAKRGAVALAEAALAAAGGADLVLTGLAGLFIGIAVAEKLARPLVQAHYVPWAPTRAYPSFLVPRPPFWPGGRVNTLSYHLARQMIWQGFRSADRLARREVLRLPAAPLWGPFNSDRTRGMPILHGYSPSVIPPPADWGPEAHVTGYWFLDPPAGWTPPPALEAFLAAGPPPVYIGFGSMSSRDPDATTDLILRSLAESGQRAIILSGWGGLRSARVPESVFALDSAPFSWLFPQMSAVVHHGGAGTTAEGLRAGVPSIVIPFFGDQPFWGQQVARLGVGPEPIPRKRLTAERLAGAIDQVVNDVTMRQRAAALGAGIRAEDGVARAVTVVQEIDGVATGTCVSAW